MRYFKLYICLLMQLGCLKNPLWGKVRIVGVDPVNGVVAVKNFYTTPIRLAQYKLSWNNSDSTIAEMEIISGDTLLQAKAFVFLRLKGLKYSDGYIALHDLRYGQKYGTTQAMADYVQWGSGGHRFESLADSTYTVSYNSTTMQNDTIRRWVMGTFLNTKAPYNFFGGSLDYGYKFWQSYKLPQLGLKLITIVPSLNRIVIKNIGAASIDISGLNICSDSGCVDSASSLQLVYGNLNIPKNDSVILEGLPMNDSMGTVSIFFPLNDRDTSNLIDFVQWGKPAQIYSAAAHLKGMNDSMQYIKSNQRDTLYYIGNYSTAQYGSNYWMAWHFVDTASQDTINTDTTGINAQGTRESLQVYPNPSVGDFYLAQIPVNMGDAILRALNTAGQVVYEKQISGNSLYIDLNFLPPGLYLLELRSKQGFIKNTKINIQ